MTAEGQHRRHRGVAAPRLLPLHWRRAAAAACILPAGLASGCASNGGFSTAALPSLPKIALPEAPPPIVGTPTEVYARIGRGAMACWFGANGFLKSTHIYDATAEPAHKGGQAEIVIRKREDAAQSPRGLKAFRIQITPAGDDKTNVVAENLKLPAETGARMKKSVAAWSIGNQGCDPDAFKGAWAPETPETADQQQKTTQRKSPVVKRKP